MRGDIFLIRFVFENHSSPHETLCIDTFERAGKRVSQINIPHFSKVHFPFIIFRFSIFKCYAISYIIGFAETKFKLCPSLTCLKFFENRSVLFLSRLWKYCYISEIKYLTERKASAGAGLVFLILVFRRRSFRKTWRVLDGNPAGLFHSFEPVCRLCLRFCWYYLLYLYILSFEAFKSYENVCTKEYIYQIYVFN